MKKVKVFFTGFWKSFDFENNMFTQIIRKKYDLEVTSDDPDFLICSALGRPYEYENFDCPRIMYTGECLSADFNAIDYFIGFDEISFGDRAFQFPLFLYNDKGGVYDNSAPLTKDEAVRELRSKEYFCNYIFGHDTELGKREEILYKLSEYKRVECAGKHKNNMPNNETYTIRTKLEFMKKCKFSITAESVSYSGFTTEKVSDAFRTLTIPIYYGDPDVGKYFNDKAFVNCHLFPNIDEAIKRIIEIDKDDELYVNMLCEYRYNVANYEETMYHALEEYIWAILEQSRDEAYRRPRFSNAGWHEKCLREYNKYMLSLPHRILKKLGI